MFENLLLVAVITSILWIALYAYYMFTSRQSSRLEEEIAALEEQLDQADRPQRPA